MKKIAGLLLTTCFVAAYGQSISEFKYVNVPAEFEKSMNKYDLNKRLVNGLKGKNYAVVQGDMASWPAELRSEPCQVAVATVLDDSNMLRNRVKIQFKDCNGKVLGEMKGNSMEKDYEPGFQEALAGALRLVPTSNGTGNIQIAQQTASPSAGKKVVVEEVKLAPVGGEVSYSEGTRSNGFGSTSNNSTNGGENYSNGSVNVQRINLGANQFILTSPNSSTPYATFTETGKAGTYRVKLSNGGSGLGYFENGNLVIEIPKGDDFQKEVFQKR